MRLSSYAGWYKGNYLRSSYEYVYAKILEKQGINYKLEQEVYYLKNGMSYKPDFFIYKKDKLIEIVEIKSEKESELKLAKLKIKLLSSIIDIPIKLYSFKELRLLCKENNLHIYTLIDEWKTSLSTDNHNNNEGIKNPMYGRKRDNSKIAKKISKKFKTDIEFRERHSKAVKEAMKKVDKSKLGHPKPREIRKCKWCGGEFEVIITSNKQYCSVSCSSTAMFHKASKMKHNKNIKKFDDIKNEVINIAIKNKEFINLIPYNKIKPKLSLLFKPILNKYRLKDMRNIYFAFYGEYKNSWKNFLDKLKEIINA